MNTYDRGVVIRTIAENKSMHICHTWNRDHTRCVVCGVHWTRGLDWQICPGT